MTAPAYSRNTWNRYARAHASVTTSYQWALFREAAERLSGDVLDCGCGTARIAPLLADRRDISSYTGVDLAPEMVTVARELVARLGRERFGIEQTAIEGVTGRFSSAVSIHSYYSWPDPLAVLARIHSVLQPHGRFVLATPNEALDMERLLYESAKELPAHPDFELFRQLNLELAATPGARFVPMDTLVEQVRAVGLGVVECHQRHYLGGVNFLLLERR